MLSAFAPVPSVALSPPETQPPSATPTQTSEDCMDDGRLVDSALGGVMIALILILTWHIIRLCCCKQKPVQYPPPAPPKTAGGTSNVATTSVRSSTSVRSNTSARAGASIRPAASERVREHTQ
uniref:Uncharacterized protein n=1 Tax=Meloidogyne javanica TaxID=6303 RepID=A0A915LL22_MELJA